MYLVGRSEPVATLPLDDFRLPNNLGRQSEKAPALCRRLFFIPAAQVIAEIPEPRDTIVLHHFDVNEEIRRSGCNDLLVVSRSPKSIRVGEALRYQVQTICKSGKPVYTLDSAPEGMTLSPSGLLQWTPTKRPASGTASAVISIADSGQTKLYGFVVGVQPRETAGSIRSGPVAAISPNGKPGDDIRFKLPAAYDDVCVGGGGRFLVFSLDSLGKLAVFDVFAAKIIGYVPVSGKCWFAAGAEKLVVFCPERNTIQRFDLKTQQLEATRPLGVGWTVPFVSMGCASEGPVLVGIGAETARAVGPSVKPRHAGVFGSPDAAASRRLG